MVVKPCVLLAFTIAALPASMAVFSSIAEAQNRLIATLPFAEDGGKLIHLAVRMNGGASETWVLDSGASECIIDRSHARRAGLSTRGSRGLSGAGKGTVRFDSIRSAVT